MLVDDPLWWWRGRRWCHLVSDASYDELHDFARGVGLPRRAFQGDHYDIPEDRRARGGAAGAVEGPSRELLAPPRAPGPPPRPPQPRPGEAAQPRPPGRPPPPA